MSTMKQKSDGDLHKKNDPLLTVSICYQTVSHCYKSLQKPVNNRTVFTVIVCMQPCARIAPGALSVLMME
ncbi:hypothetical protein [Undibacterium pigrum]|uniref:hypothetical protein n=1 Tax=Undibacterium pigrum TaxID=401470 RepID=UPI001B87D609|nr:hypothetical protein [Undibacterium pigrum]